MSFSSIVLSNKNEDRVKQMFSLIIMEFLNVGHSLYRCMFPADNNIAKKLELKFISNYLRPSRYYHCYISMELGTMSVYIIFFLNVKCFY